MHHGHRKNTRRNRTIRKVIIISAFVIIVAALLLLIWTVASGLLDSGKEINSGGESSGIVSELTTTTTSAPAPTVSAGALVSAPRVIAYNLTSGYTMFARGENDRCSPASLTKLLTAIVAAQNSALNSEFTVGDELAYVDNNASRAWLVNGQKMSYETIMDALMMCSGNDAAYTIAANIGRKLLNNPEAATFDALIRFIEEMNAVAAKIGASGSNFINPDGMDAPNHYSTAYDILTISKKALEYDVIKASVGKTRATHTLLSGGEVTYTNTNKLLLSSGNFYFEGTTGLKTGSLDAAGYCLAASASRDDTEIIVIVMGCLTDESRFVEARQILTDCYAALQK